MTRDRWQVTGTGDTLYRVNICSKYQHSKKNHLFTPQKSPPPQKKFFFFWTLQKKWWYYPHWSRDSVSLVWGIFLIWKLTNGYYILLKRKQANKKGNSQLNYAFSCNCIFHFLIKSSQISIVLFFVRVKD